MTFFNTWVSYSFLADSQGKKSFEDSVFRVAYITIGYVTKTVVMYGPGVFSKARDKSR